MLGKEITLIQMRVAAEDEGAHAHVHVAVQFGKDLSGIADDGAGAAATREADAAPEMRLEVEIGALGTEFVLAFHSGALAVLRTRFDLGSFGGVELGDESISSGAGFGFGFADNDMRAKAEVNLAVIRGGFLGHDAHRFGDTVLGFRPHEEDIAMLRAQVLCGGRDAAEVHERAAVLLIRLGGFGGGEADAIKFTFPLEGAVGAPHALQDLDDLAGAGIADFVALFHARHVGGDDVDAQAAFGDVIDGGERPREHRRPHFTHAEGDKLIDLCRLWCHGGGKGQCVLTSDPTRGEQDVLIAEGVGFFHNIAAVLIAGAQAVIWHAKKFVIVCAKSREPGDFGLAVRRADG